MKKSLPLCFFILTIFTLSSQDVSNLDPLQPPPASAEPTQESPSLEPLQKLFPNALGYSFGDLTGTGFTFRQWIGDWGWQISGLVFFDPNQISRLYNDYLYHSTGFALMHTLFSGMPTPWFYTQLYGIAHISFAGHSPYDYNVTTEKYTVSSYRSTSSLGAGLGIELGIYSHFSWVLEVSERAQLQFPIDAKSFSLGPQFQTSLLYRF